MMSTRANRYSREREFHDAWADATLSGGDTSEAGSPAAVGTVVDAALGLI